MIPTSTGAAKNIGTIFKHLNGKISGLAIRVPTPTVSMVDFVFLAKNPVSVDQINNVMINASKSDLSGVLGACDDPVVSSDFIGNVNSAVVDLGLTSVINNNLCKVIAWYDNELAFAVRMLDICEF
uniref:Glyceraldehyde 3-phosphate dehydrogenase catalytic domain-containing protein n=1 Tax=Biomphalaria glabrata TaxID=6526 RepID=A0A2C9LQF4_BIOGL